MLSSIWLVTILSHTPFVMVWGDNGAAYGDGDDCSGGMAIAFPTYLEISLISGNPHLDLTSVNIGVYFKIQPDA